MRAIRLPVYICLASAALLPALAFATPPTYIAGSPTLTMLVDSAWQRSPSARTLEARREEIAAGRDTAQSWIAAAPALGLSHRSDRWTEQQAQRENEVSLSAPIWLPAQKAARQALAARNADELAAQIALARLALAGEVRTRIWEAAAAREALAEKQDHQHHLEELAEEVQRRVKAGDLARSDALLAQQELLAARGEVAHASSRDSEALARYRILTGYAQLPPLEPESAATETGAQHGRLVAARAAEQRAQAALEMAQATRGGPPTVALSMRREQDGMSTSANRSIGIALQVPLGTQARNRPAETQAATQIASAAAETAQARATVDAEVALARERLVHAGQALEAAVERAAAMREHTRLFEQAFRQGERSLAELLRSRALRHESDVAVRQQRVALGQAQAQLNQALGIVP